MQKVFGTFLGVHLNQCQSWIARCTWAELKLDIDDLSNDDK